MRVHPVEYYAMDIVWQPTRPDVIYIAHGY